MGQGKRYQAVESTRFSAVIFLFCWAAYFSTYIGRLNYSAAMAQMIQDGVLTKSEGGIIATAFFACYGVGQLLNGFAADRVSPFGMVFSGVFLSGLMNFGMSMPVGFVGMCLFWGGNGVAQSMVWAPIIRIFSQILPGEQRLRASVHINSTVPAGSLAAYLLSTALLSAAGWPELFRAASLCMVTVAGAWALFFFAKRKHFQWEPRPARPRNAPRAGKGLWGALAASGVALALLPAALHGMLKDGITTWFPTSLTESYAITPETAVLLAALLPVVNLGGGYLASWINTRFTRNEMKTAAWMFALSAAALLCLTLFSGNLILFICMSGIATASMFGVNTVVISVLPMYFGRRGIASAVSGVLNSAAYFGCAVSMGLFGGVAQQFGWTAVAAVWLGIALLGGGAFLLASKRWKLFRQEEENPA